MEAVRELITTDPEVMLGKPVVAGTRITVEEILRRLAAGEHAEDILEAHPRLTLYFLARLRALAPVRRCSSTNKARSSTFPNGPDFLRGTR
jgi:uncharacterized protein (DUF433 family)